MIDQFCALKHIWWIISWFVLSP